MKRQLRQLERRQCVRPRTNRPGTEPPRCGFTLIEMLAATVVIAMLMVALAGISHATSRQARRAKKIRNQFPSAALVESQITHDIRNADGMQSLPNGVILFGAIGSDPAGTPTQQLARVTYQIRNLRGLRVLIRTEQQARGLGHQRIVWMDVTSLSVNPVGMTIGNPQGAKLSGGLTPTPTSVDVQLLGSEGTSVFAKRIRHHREFQ